jgi:hypothetical protein
MMTHFIDVNLRPYNGSAEPLDNDTTDFVQAANRQRTNGEQVTQGLELINI